jgi:hypothetical protein
MKTTKILSAISIVLIFAVFNNSKAQLPGGTILVTTYVVTVENNLNTAGFAGSYYIGIINDRGNLIAPVQPFRLGTWSYTFKEVGSAQGRTRTALMKCAPGPICSNDYVVKPSTLNGPFKPGLVYNFHLVPIKPKPLVTGETPE